MASALRAVPCLRPALLALTLLAPLLLSAQTALGDLPPPMADPSPRLAGGGGEGGGWAIVKFRSNGARVAFWEQMDVGGEVGVQAALLADRTGRWLFGYFNPFGSHDATVGVDVAEGTATYESASPGPERPGWVDHPHGHNKVVFRCDGLCKDNRTGEDAAFYAIVMAVGVRSWSWSFHGDPGVEVLGVREGSETLAYNHEDFKGVAEAHAAAWTPGVETIAPQYYVHSQYVFAQANAGTSIDVDAAGVFVGVFTAPKSMAAVLETPERIRACPCLFGDPTGPNALEARGLRFHLDGVAGRDVGHAFLVGAFVQVPG